MSDKTYNGWSSYETWLVKLWMDNEQGTQEYFSEQAERVLKDNPDDPDEEDNDSQQSERIHMLAEMVKEHHEESLPKLEGFAADLMNAALSEVDWNEIANSLLEDAKEALS